MTFWQFFGWWWACWALAWVGAVLLKVVVKLLRHP